MGAVLGHIFRLASGLGRDFSTYLLLLFKKVKSFLAEPWSSRAIPS